MNKKTIIFFSIIISLAILEGIIILMLNKKQDINIKLTNDYTKYMVSFDKVKNIKEYTVQIFKNDEVVDERTINDTEYEFELFDYNYEDDYSVLVTYIDKKDNVQTVGEKIEFKWDEPSFSEDNISILSKENNIIKIDGNVSKNDYYIELYNGNNLLVKDKLVSNEYKASDSIFKTSGEIKGIIRYNDEEISERMFYSGINPIENIKISNIKNGDYIDASNMIINYTGGNKANKFKVRFSKNNKVLKEVDLPKDGKIDTSGLELNTNYSVTVVALLEGVERTNTINIWLLSKLRAGMVNTALKEVGNEGGKKFWSWYANWGRFEWCACFLSWVAEQNGILDKKIPKFIGVGDGINYYKKKNRYLSRKEYTPKAGDLIFIDWNDNNRVDHVGMVLKVENNRVYTIEGNRQDAVRLESYPTNSIVIAGYGAPEYE